MISYIFFCNRRYIWESAGINISQALISNHTHVTAPIMALLCKASLYVNILLMYFSFFGILHSLKKQLADSRAIDQAVQGDLIRTLTRILGDWR